MTKIIIYNHVKALEKNIILKKPGGQNVLHYCNEKENLVHALIKCGKWGFLLKCREIQFMVKSYSDRLAKFFKNRF